MAEASSSSSSTSRDSEPKFKDIKVQINRDTPILMQLPINKKLNEIRPLLADEVNVRMGSKMYFMTPVAKILQANECKYLLSKILYNNNLKIIGEQEPDWEYIKNTCKLEYGVVFSKKGPVSAKKKAFDITGLHLRKLARPITIDETIVCQTDFDKSCVENLLAKVEVTAKLPWSSSISATLGGSIETENHINIGNLSTYRTSKRINAKLSYSEQEVKPTKEFIKAVDVALVSDDPRKNLKIVAKEYGPLWCNILGIGGRILFIESQETNLNEYISSTETTAAGNIRVTEYAEIGGEAGRCQQMRQMNSFINKYSFFRMFGGSEESYHEFGMSGWLSSLNDYQQWAVAEYTEINSIFDILDQDRRSKVAAALTKQILESKIETLSFRMDFSRTDPYSHELPQNLQLSNTDQIFVTIMKEDESKNLFATRVHYIDDKSPPVILIHRLGKLKKRSKSPIVNLKLGWIVIGTSTMLNLFGQSLAQQPVFESDEIKASTCNSNKRLIAIITNKRKKDPNSSILATCVSRTNDLQQDPMASKYIAGTHFVNNDKNNAIEACTFCYDLQNMKPCLQFDNMPVKLSVNYSIVAGTGKLKFGQTQITSKPITSKPLGSILSQSKRFEVCFDVYLNLTEQPTTPPTSSLSEREQSLSSSSAQRTLQSPIFISLVSDNCPAHCVHGFFNITPNHAIFKSLKNSFTKNGQVAYFCVPTRNRNEEDGD
ncbi:2074_t:CDS:2 [Ambispora gerdemannii]|uniref:2074_t:CDS:1 n=1 Tax=Ambispora gerdemannii TaxID=144530 RepID=A0A9N9BHT3_9GLOM|nr:2074_t:CDS:2 [Ambispora gerdemannii]